VRLRWPPPPLGLGAPLNLVTLSRELRPRFQAQWWLAPVLGLAAGLTVIGIDALFFGGETARRTPSLSEHPSLLARILISIVGSIGEELFFRVLVATTIAWVVYLAARRLSTRSVVIAQTISVVAAALWVGLWHVGMAGDLWRVVSVNLVGNLLYGWLYWRRGLEMAIMAHVVVTATLFIGIPAFR
jgi:membrane protease YdiL (CAAX protease family)